jgi:ABC-type sugar transport system substrate-binding protein
MSPPRYGTKLEPQNYEIGYALGQTAAEYLNRERGGAGSVLALAPAAFTSAVRRIEAMRTAVARIAPRAIWLGSQDVFDSEQARSVVAELLAGGMQPDVIIANSDAIAYGAIDALQAAAVPPDAVIVLGALYVRHDRGEPRGRLCADLSLDRPAACRLGGAGSDAGAPERPHHTRAT